VAHEGAAWGGNQGGKLSALRGVCSFIIEGEKSFLGSRGDGISGGGGCGPGTAFWKVIIRHLGVRGVEEKKIRQVGLGSIGPAVRSPNEK